MKRELYLPHGDFIRFAESVIECHDNRCVVDASFPSTPTLPMMIEAAAQCSAAFATQKHQDGYLVALKGITLHQKASSNSLRYVLTLEHQMGELAYFNFEAFEDDTTIVTGTLVISFIVN